ncbi:MAG: hypothetical protein QN141_01880 [Armatimonadota bacterium]|nr:hypothetical protein [Armatimonadota bacterium]MDR7450971.1 hypothetical protein [Armatimonadota bacterium]MDR7466008.1 hypothetical protein [Armatimonadota bacterium]MDR7494073.1 hypothetical protein [Armatimonadota bacterium]MDR7504060.1 hypothetical protein [Armatimonadota bacterium]
MRKVVRATGLVGVTLLLALAWRAAVGTAQPARPDPCRLLTAQDVTGALGAGYRKAQQEVAALTTQACAYMKGPENYAEVLVFGPVEDGNAAVRQQREFFDKNRKVTPLPSLGSNGYYVIGPVGIGPGKKELITVKFGKGRWWVHLRAVTGGKSNIDASLKLAAIVYARLPN